MNDEPRPNTWVRNTHEWDIGDLVIHYGDAKKTEYLMRVVSIRKNGNIMTEYANRVGYQKTYENTLEALLDPARFDITVTQ